MWQQHVCRALKAFQTSLSFLKPSRKRLLDSGAVSHAVRPQLPKSLRDASGVSVASLSSFVFPLRMADDDYADAPAESSMSNYHSRD